MAIRPGYFVKESATNLWRNLLMTSAAILTVAVSLVFVGAGLLFRQGVNNATQQFRGGVEIAIYMKPESTTDQRDAVRRELESMPEIKRVKYVDQAAAYKEFQTLFRNDPDTRESITSPTQLPPSFRIVPNVAEQSDQIGAKFRTRAGVYNVTYARDQVKSLLSFFRRFQVIIIVVAAFVLVAGVLLILNTIRMAIFARRREVAVMKLVGATNWFIRLPFMLEGLLEGLVGAIVAFGAIWGANRLFQNAIEDVALFRQFSVSPGQVVGTGIFVLIAGAVVGSIGSAIAVSRFLDV